MFRWLIVCVVLCGGAFYLVSLAVRSVQSSTPTVDKPEPNPTDKDKRISGWTEDSNAAGDPTTGPTLIMEKSGEKNGLSPTVLRDARIVVAQKQEVGSEKAEGAIRFYGTELKPGEEKTVPPDRLISQMFVYFVVEVAYDRSNPAAAYPLAGTPEKARPFMVPNLVKDPVSLNPSNNFFYLDNDESKVYTRWKKGMPLYAGHVRLIEEERKFRKLEEQDRVEKGDLLALINFEPAIIDLRTKYQKLDSAEADREASARTREEAATRLQKLREQEIRTPRSVQPEEMRGAELNEVRYRQEELSKRAAVRAAEYDVVQAMEFVTMHEVRAAIPGVVKAITKNRGDSVKANQDVILQLVNPLNLRAEALVEVQDVEKLYKGQNVQLEVSLRMTPSMVLSGAHQQINAVAVSNDVKARRLIVAASEDKTLRGWDARTGLEAWKPVRLREAVRALACTPKGAEQNLLLVGSADGSAYLFDLSKTEVVPTALPERHKGPITAVAFSPDGKVCATADDRAIILWAYKADTGKWERQQTLVDPHRAAVTSLAFSALPTADGQPATGNWRLVSAGRDNVINSWKVEPGKPLVRDVWFERRSGDVTQLGTDGERALFDSAKELRVVSLRDKHIEGTLQNASTSATFSTMALFSPDGRTILTNGGSEGKPQLWRAPPKAADKDPLAEGRGSELRQLATKSTATCGAFGPEGDFAVTGMQDGQVLVWKMPNREESEKRIPATISMVEKTVDTNHQVRIWAEVKDTPAWLAPGSSATIVVMPDATESK